MCIIHYSQYYYSIDMSSHYYDGDDGKTPPPPPLPPPRKSQSFDCQNSSSGVYPSTVNPYSSFQPLLPKRLKNPTHPDSASRSPPPSRTSLSTVTPPQLPLRPPKPIPKHPPRSIPARSQSLMEQSKRIVPRPPVAPHTQSVSDSSDEEGYVDITFNSKDGVECLYSESDGTALLRFVEQNQDRFPLPFEVVLGYSSRSEDVSISEGERFIAHFLKRAKVLTIVAENNHQYYVPLNSSFQFSPLHNPNNNKKEALSGFFFKTAGDVMLSRCLPRVMRVKKPYRGAGPEYCVTLNELLLVKAVVQNEDEKKYLKCIQASSGKEKRLHEECNGEFTTAPHEVRVYLPQLLDHFQLPIDALMSMGPENEEDIPSHLMSMVVTISMAHIEQSLVASTIIDEAKGKEWTVPEDMESVVLNDIPLNFDINVNIMAVSPSKADKILKLTDRLYSSFSPADVCPYLANYSRSQLCLVKSLRKEDSPTGITLVETKSIQEMRRQAAELEKANTPTTATPASFVDDHLTARLQQLETQNKLLKQTLEQIIGRPIEAAANSVTLDKLQSDHSKMKQELKNLSNAVERLTSKLLLIYSIKY